MVERPIVNDSIVVGWLAGWKPERPFAIDMAGFSVNLGYAGDFLYKKPNAHKSGSNTVD